MAGWMVCVCAASLGRIYATTASIDPNWTDRSRVQHERHGEFNLIITQAEREALQLSRFNYSNSYMANKHLLHSG